MKPLKHFKWIGVAMFLISLCHISDLQGQTFNYASSTTASSGVSNSNNAIDQNLSSASTLTPGAIFGLAKQDLTFSSTVPAGTTLRLKIGEGSSLLSVGVYVNIRVYNNLSQVGSTYELNSLLGLLNGSGTETLEITPNGNYNKVEIEIGVALSLGASIKVYEAYYITGSTGGCNLAYDVISGTNGALLGGLSGVTNPNNVIDNNDNTYASLASIASVGSGNYVRALFPNSTTGSVSVLLGDPAQLLSLGVLNGFAIRTYNGNSLQYTYNASHLISLSLLSGSNKGWLTFQPSGSFDRVEVEAGGLVGALSSLRVYEIQRGPITTDDSDDLICYLNQGITIDASDYGSGDAAWHNSDNEYIETDSEYETGNLTEDKTYYALFYNNCDQVTHVETINVEVIALSPQALATGETTIPYSDDLNIKLDGLPEGRTYSYALANGESLPNGLTLNSDGSITGTPTQDGNYSFDVVVTDITDAMNPIPTGTHEFSMTISQTLPIVLTDFDVELDEEISNITWTAENQSDILEYQVQRSVDGINWITIMNLQPSNLYSDEYHYQDQITSVGKIYYRLKIMENDESIVYSNIVNVNYQDQIKTLITSYPNPSRNKIQIVNDHPQAITYTLYNVLGVQLETSMSINPRSRTTVDISHIENGMYYIQYRDVSGNIISGEMRLKQ
ncbi:putative Ig domain-containing protein [Membranihabitans marinus]|uniref:putative Ig domain-containing protein n=1 Tax=Membranihabitans marinus TaxID=1227546 RepID=UPI001F33121E|nr:putative Ig domain-containing protein [Membranihabitans marinus]